MQRITILGATGSIGTSTLDIIAAHPERYCVFALTAYQNIERLVELCHQFKPQYAVIVDDQQAAQLENLLKNLPTKVLVGTEALIEVSQSSETDIVMAGIVGSPGLAPTIAAAKAGKRILLANKEPLVMAGQLFMQEVVQGGATLLPVDSEHNAVFQCLPQGYQIGVTPESVDHITLTASGGPFREVPLEQFDQITPEQAVAHPTWSMGHKISVDSATLFNKGLEVIEAHHLFNLPQSQIEVVIHPQSTVHAAVAYNDGTVLTHLGRPDMRVAISSTLAWPLRIRSGVSPLKLNEISNLTFQDVDYKRYPCFKLALQALQTGGSAPTILNAANEVAVAQFLAGKRRFTQISEIIEKALQDIEIAPVTSLECVIEADKTTRNFIAEMVAPA